MGCFANHTIWQISWSIYCIDGCLYGSTANRDSRIGLANQLARKRQMFEAEVSSALEDGVLTGDEVKHLNSLKENYHISDEQARAIIEMLSNNREKNDK